MRQASILEVIIIGVSSIIIAAIISYAINKNQTKEIITTLKK